MMQKDTVVPTIKLDPAKILGGVDASSGRISAGSKAGGFRLKSAPTPVIVLDAAKVLGGVDSSSSRISAGSKSQGLKPATR